MKCKNRSSTDRLIATINLLQKILVVVAIVLAAKFLLICWVLAKHFLG